MFATINCLKTETDGSFEQKVENLDKLLIDLISYKPYIKTRDATKAIFIIDKQELCPILCNLSSKFNAQCIN